MGEGGDGAGEVVLLLLGCGEVEPRLRVVRMLLRLALERAHRRAAAAGALEEVAERVADPGRARADAEEDEAEREDDREEDEDPLGVPAQPREEELVLPAVLLLRLLRLDVGARRYGSIRCRAALA